MPTLSANPACVLAVPASATITILDDELPVVAITVTDPNSAEAGPDAGTFKINRTGPTTNPLMVNYTINRAAANGGYQSIGTSLNIAAGSATGTITIMPIDDNLPERA